MDVSLIVAATDDTNMAWKLAIIGPPGSGFMEEWDHEGCDGIPTIEAIDSIRERNPDTRILLSIVKPDGVEIARTIEVGEVGYGEAPDSPPFADFDKGYDALLDKEADRDE